MYTRIALALGLLPLLFTTAQEQQDVKPIVQNTGAVKFQKLPNLPDCITAAVEQGDPANGPSVLVVKGGTGCSAPWHFHTPNEQLMMISGTGRVEMKGEHAVTLRAGGFANRARVEVVWVPSDTCETEAGAARALSDVDGVLVPGGFGVRGIEGKIGAIRYARTRGIPALGLCLGLQCMVIDVARELAGVTDANSAEFDERTPNPVISTMADQTDVIAGERDMGGTMRLGAYPAKLRSGSLAADAYGSAEVSERHRHRYEVNNAYRDRLAKAGLVFSGTSPDGHLVEFVELSTDQHPFYVGTQAHPELKSRPTRPHPLFVAFIGAALDYRAADRLPVELPEAATAGVQS